MKKLIFERLNAVLVNDKLNNLANTEVNELPFMTILTLTKPSPKHHMSAHAPFPAIVKPAAGGLAVFNCVTGKTENISEGSYLEPSPVGNSFEYKGNVYELKDKINGMPRYVLKKSRKRHPVPEPEVCD